MEKLKFGVTKKSNISLFIFCFVSLIVVSASLNKVKAAVSPEIYIKFYEDNGSTIDKSVTNEEIDVNIELLSSVTDDNSYEITYQSPIGKSNESFEFTDFNKNLEIPVKIVDGVGSIKLSELPNGDSSDYKYRFSMKYNNFSDFNTKYVAKFDDSSKSENEDYGQYVDLQNKNSRIKSLEFQFLKNDSKEEKNDTVTKDESKNSNVTVNYYVKGTTTKVTDKYGNAIDSITDSKPVNASYKAPKPSDLNNKWVFDSAFPSESITVSEKDNVIDMFYSENNITLVSAVLDTSSDSSGGNPFDLGDDSDFVDPFEDDGEDYDPFDDVSNETQGTQVDNSDLFDDVSDEKDVAENKEKVMVVIDGKERYAEYNEDKGYYTIYDEFGVALGYSEDLDDPIEISPFGGSEEFVNSEDSKGNPKTSDTKFLIPTIIILGILSFMVINFGFGKKGDHAK